MMAFMKESKHMSVEEANKVALRAIRLWQRVQDNPTERDYNDFVSLMQLAIKQAGQPVAPYHAILAQCHFDVNNFAAAWQEAGIALSLDADDYKSQYIRALIAYANYVELADQAKEKDLGVMGTLGQFRNIGGGYKRGYQAGYTIGDMIGTKRSRDQALKLFGTELAKMLDIFRRITRQGMPSNEFEAILRDLLRFADGIAAAQIKLTKEYDVYALVANAPVDNIEIEDDEQAEEIETIKLIAQARMVG